MDVIVGIPVKPFPDAKQRLAEALDDPVREELGRMLAVRTVDTVLEAGGTPLVLSADVPVTEWARSLDVEVLVDEGSSLDEAAAAAVAAVRARGAAWAILHADLPVLAAAELVPALGALAAGRSVIAPSSDGGTSMIGAPLDRFPFSYGPGSYHRHLAALGPLDPLVLTDVGLMLDLDLPSDLEAASATAGGAWLPR